MNDPDASTMISGWVIAGWVVAGWVGLNYSFRWSRESDLVLELPGPTGHLPWVSAPRSPRHTAI